MRRDSIAPSLPMLLLCVLLGACSDQRIPLGVPHSTGEVWVVGHGAPAQADLTPCKSCHGADLLGGTSGVSCSNCHFGPDGRKGPPTVDAEVWTHESGSARTRHAAKNLFSAAQQEVCITCHGLMKGFTAHPAVTDCSTSTCHGLSFHGAGFLGAHPGEAKQDVGACRTCHNTPTPPPNFDGYVTGVACSTCHDQGIAHPPGPASAPDWYVSHRTAGNTGTACAVCHNVTSTPGSGPLADAPGCFGLSSFGGRSCHTTGPGTGVPHAVPFKDPALHGPDAKGNPGLPFCQECHAAPPTGRNPAPRFNVAIGSLHAGCEDCHAAKTAHPSPGGGDGMHWYGSFVTHANAINTAGACGLCHGASLEGDVGPACVTCHTLGSPLTKGNCSSCHGSPPDDGSASASAPNRQGAHGTHNALQEVASVCNPCHSGGGTMTSAHFNDAKLPWVAILGDYNAKAGGPAKFTVTSGGDGTCAAVSCHGGQPTPNWLTGSLTVGVDCTKCHSAGPGQYNGYVSGEHGVHVSTLELPCTACHDPATLQPGSAHFAHLKTPAMEGPAAATIGGKTTFVSAYAAATQTCTPKAGLGCHGARSWVGD